MNENIKKLVLELAEKAIGHERFRFHISGLSVVVMVLPNDMSQGWEWDYYARLDLDDEDTEDRLRTALKFINNLGGNKNEIV